MIGVRKQVFSPKGSLTRVACDFSGEGAHTEGMLVENGGLVKTAGEPIYCGGAGEFSFPEDCTPERLYFLRTSAGMCAAAYAAGKLYFCAGDGGAFSDTGLTFSAPPAAARLYDGEEALVLSDGENVCLVKSGGAVVCSDIPAFSCAGYAYDRLWTAGTENGVPRVRFSALLDAHDFEEEGGSIDLPDERGEILAFAETEGAFFLVREFGVQKLTVAGEENGFALTDIDTPFAKICRGSVCGENGEIFFLADGTLYRLDAGGAEAFYPAYAGVFSGGGCAAAACGGKVYFCGDTEDGAVTAVFAEDGSGALFMKGRRTALSRMPSPAGAIACFYADGGVRALRGTGDVPGRWYGRVLPPFDGAPAILEEIALTASGEFTVTAESEWGSRTFDVCLTGETKRMRTSLRGTRFRFCVVARKEGRVEALTAGYSRAY